MRPESTLVGVVTLHVRPGRPLARPPAELDCLAEVLGSASVGGGGTDEGEDSDDEEIRRAQAALIAAKKKKVPSSYSRLMQEALAPRVWTKRMVGIASTP